MSSRRFSLAIFSSPKNSTIDQQSWYTHKLKKTQHWLIITLSKSITSIHLLPLLLTWEMVCCPLNTMAFIKVMIFNQVKLLWYIEYINRRIRLKLQHVNIFSNLDMLSETPRYPISVNNRWRHPQNHGCKHIAYCISWPRIKCGGYKKVVDTIRLKSIADIRLCDL